jgi:hypothetical protein
MSAAASSVKFEQAAVAVTATYVGGRTWELGRGAKPVENRSASGAIRDALGLSTPVAPGTRIEVRAVHIRRGTLANNSSLRLPGGTTWTPAPAA